tara:strand:+ start:556 stop:1404 length:849 start_codon:yes stop_codon:yes gene_type:complete
MAYIGKDPADSFISFVKQDFSVSATTSYTLDNAVTNQNEIALFINHVRQEPTTAYTASGTSLTLTSATASGDDMYCVYLGMAKQTVNAPDGSVGSSQVAASIITGQTALGATPADTDELLISDAGTLKRVDYSYLKSTNTPAFKAFAASAQSLSSGTTTKVVFGTESYDTDSAYDHSTNHRFTVPSGKAGKYVFTSNFYAAVDNGTLEEQQFSIRKNGSDIASTAVDFRNNDDGSDNGMILTTTLDLSVGDYIEVFVTIVATNPAGRSGEANVYFTGHKLII